MENGALCYGGLTEGHERQTPRTGPHPPISHDGVNASGLDLPSRLTTVFIQRLCFER